MEDLASYLNNEYRFELQEIDQITALVTEVIPIFKIFYSEEDGKWPYEVANGLDPAYPEGGYYSFSTSAMILFALSASLGLPYSSVLIPSLSHGDNKGIIWENKDLVSIVETTLRKGINKFIEESNRLRRSEEPMEDGSPLISKSRAYGKNDPFTLLWMLEVLNPLSSDPDINKFCELCKRTFGNSPPS